MKAMTRSNSFDSPTPSRGVAAIDYLCSITNRDVDFDTAFRRIHPEPDESPLGHKSALSRQERCRGAAERYVVRRLLDMEAHCREFLAASSGQRVVPGPFLLGFAEKARARYPL